MHKLFLHSYGFIKGNKTKKIQCDIVPDVINTIIKHTVKT